MTINSHQVLGKYRLTEELYAGDRTLVYRAIPEIPKPDYSSVILKLLRQDYPTFNDLLQFRNQYTIAKNLDIPGIVRPLSLENYRNGYILVMEDFGGISLRNYTKTQKLSLQEVLEISHQIANILHQIHQNKVIHKDIKPANILINPHTKKIKIIDFSIASLLPKETEEIKNPGNLEGTLAYLAPEQTGRMNRGIDYRTDFYALGITLFELLTGKLPFETQDPMDLLHCHLAQEPPDICKINSQIPAVISSIVAKLMAKNTEDRYQSAWGLKHDLEICLKQLKSTGKIVDFLIAQRDISEKLSIPEKLYGREQEIKILLEAFERIACPQDNSPANVKSEMMLVAGFSGIGKTAVINEVHKPITRQKGYFIKGKFDQFQRNIPFSAFVQAFRHLIGQLLSESDAQIQTWKSQILNAVGENGQVLIDVIPELEKIIGKQPPALELSGTVAQNRFNLLFHKFLQIFTSKDHPLVIFLDDLQWADSASLNLLKLLMQESAYLLILGAYRDNEVSPVHPFILTVDELVKIGAKINTITLPPLKETDLNRLVADTLNCELSLAQPLTKLVYQKTQGNPFFATQFIKGLYDEQLITFNREIHHWQCDIAQVEVLAITDDVVKFMRWQLQKLPRETENILKLAACIGAQFDLNTLAIVSEQSSTKTATDLWKALQEGLVIPITKIYKFFTQSDPDEAGKTSANPTYRFLHDRVQQAAYSLIPSDQKQITHLKIGQLLQQNLSQIEKEEKLFDIVGHLNLGIALITEAKEREELAKLNLAAGRKARNATAYNASKIYLQTGTELLTKNCWQSQYELTLNLYVAATESAYLNGEFAEIEKKANLVLQSARNILDKVKIYEIKISALTAQSQMLEAIYVGKNALAELGVNFSSEPDEALTNQALQTIGDQLQGKQIQELVDLHLMSDPQTIAAMQLLAMLFPPIFMGNPALLPLLCATMVNLSLQFGNAPASTIGYVGYGMVLCAFFGKVETGYCFGRLALSLLNQLNVQEFKSITLLWFGCFIQHRQEALRATIPTVKAGYLAGMETGDFLNAGYSIINYSYNNLFAGVEIADWEAEIENYCVALAQVKQYSPVAYLKLTQQMGKNLQEIVNDPDLFSGTAYDETLMIPKHHQDNEITILAFVYIYKLILAYLFAKYTNAIEYIAKVNPYLMAAAGLIHIPIFHFYAGLTYLALALKQSEIEQANTLYLVEIHQNVLAEWAHHTPMNYQHKVDLLEAEKSRILGNNYQAGDWYDRAIAGAKENGFIQEQALASELAAKFYLDWGKEKVAAGYMQEAYYCYAKWGSLAKIDNLEKRYPQLLQPIIQPQKFNYNPLATLATMKGVSLRTVTHSTNSSSMSISDAWDLSAVLKAAQAISSTIELDELLKQLTQIMLQNSGADQCILLFPTENKWQARAMATPDSTELFSEAIDNYHQLPISLIQYVKNTQSIVVIDNLKTDLPVIDDYLWQQQPKSILCLPALDRGNLVAILYLKNQGTVGVFTRDRILVLNFLCTQAAISLQNAHLYQQAQQALIDLKEAQLQIVQSEKMSALGNLVAGIAHEINNPLGFIAGNLTEAKTSLTDLIEHLNLYRFAASKTEIEAHAEQIDLDYVLADLPQIIDSMEEGCDRIKNISTSLRTFSRADKDYQISFNIHAGIDSTIMILKHRLKANENRPEIQVIKAYSNLPEIECFPGQLNQVFMNILANAIDMFDEMAQTYSFEYLTKKNLEITIKTELLSESNQVTIKIKDNGLGMAENIKSRIFEYLFTTKVVGKGTGLGLAIARKIVLEKHGGSIDCYSQVGQGTEFIIQLPIGK